MKEYKYRVCNSLIDSESGESPRVYVPVEDIPQYDELSERAFKSGAMMRHALDCGVVAVGDGFNETQIDRMVEISERHISGAREHGLIKMKHHEKIHSDEIDQ